MSWKTTWPTNNPLKGVHTDLLWIAPLFIMAMGKYGCTATVNHGTDGKHSVHSAHGKGQALDINHKDIYYSWGNGSKDWWMATASLAAGLAKLANMLSRLVNSETEYYMVLEPSHFHLEITLHGEAPNIKGWERGKYYYTHPDVRKILEAA